MPERLACEFFLIRYVPDPVKGEFLNIGVVVREVALGKTSASEAGVREAGTLVRFTRDWTRVRCLHPDADLPLLEALEAELQAALAAEFSSLLRQGDTRPKSIGTPKPILDLLADSLSNSVQISESRATLAESLAAELDLLMALYVEPLRAQPDDSNHRRTGRAAIASAMRREFERAGVWPLLRKRIAAAQYTHPGDPLRLDCGYRPNFGVPGEPARGGDNGTIRMFHAVSLAGDAEAAKVLAYSAPRLREGVARIENATLDLAAVIEPLREIAGSPASASESGPATESDDAAARYRFGVTTLEEGGIRILTIVDLARAAATARSELHV